MMCKKRQTGLVFNTEPHTLTSFAFFAWWFSPDPLGGWALVPYIYYVNKYLWQGGPEIAILTYDQFRVKCKK